MLKCPYEDERRGDLIVDGITMESGCRCHILMVATGFIVSCGVGNCRLCIKNEEWNQQGAPQLKPRAKPVMPTEQDAMAIIRASKHFSGLYLSSLKGRLIAGDCPRYQGPNPVDIFQTFEKLLQFAGETTARETLGLMFEKQSRIPESDGGHPADVLAVKLEALATANGMEDVLIQIVEDHERAAEIISGAQAV